MAGHIFTVAELMYISGNCVSRPHSVHDVCHTALPGGAHVHLPRLHPPTDLLIESKSHSKTDRICHLLPVSWSVVLCVPACHSQRSSAQHSTAANLALALAELYGSTLPHIRKLYDVQPAVGNMLCFTLWKGLAAGCATFIIAAQLHQCLEPHPRHDRVWRQQPVPHTSGQCCH